MSKRVVYYGKVSRSVTGEALKVRLTRDLTLAPSTGSSSDDELSQDSGRTWRILDDYLHFGFVHPRTGQIRGKKVRKTSDIPICDKVLTLNGDSILTSNTIRVIRDLSKLITESSNLTIVEGAFDCAVSIAAGAGKPRVNLKGDRPFPYFYSQDAPRIQRYVFHTARINGDSRKVTFVKTGGSTWLSDDLRDELLYLLPREDNKEDHGSACMGRILATDTRGKYGEKKTALLRGTQC